MSKFEDVLEEWRAALDAEDSASAGPETGKALAE